MSFYQRDSQPNELDRNVILPTLAGFSLRSRSCDSPRGESSTTCDVWRLSLPYGLRAVAGNGDVLPHRGPGVIPMSISYPY